MALTYTLLGERADVTRQTLYRHWPAPTELLTELVLTGPDVGYPPPNTDPAVVATEFLTSLRAGMNDPTTAAIVIALADHDTHSSDALAAVAENRRVALNTLLSDTDRSVSPDEFARLVAAPSSSNDSSHANQLPTNSSTPPALPGWTARHHPEPELRLPRSDGNAAAAPNSPHRHSP